MKRFDDKLALSFVIVDLLAIIILAVMIIAQMKAINSMDYVTRQDVHEIVDSAFVEVFD